MSNQKYRDGWDRIFNQSVQEDVLVNPFYMYENEPFRVKRTRKADGTTVFSSTEPEIKNSRGLEHLNADKPMEYITWEEATGNQ